MWTVEGQELLLKHLRFPDPIESYNKDVENCYSVSWNDRVIRSTRGNWNLCVQRPNLVAISHLALIWPHFPNLVSIYQRITTDGCSHSFAWKLLSLLQYSVEPVQLSSVVLYPKHRIWMNSFTQQVSRGRNNYWLLDQTDVSFSNLNGRR